MRLRLFPILIVAAALSFAVKTNDIWRGLDSLTRVQSAAAGTPPDGMAQDTAPAQAKGEPAGDTSPAPMVSQSSNPLAMTDEEIDLLQRLAERRAEIERRASELDRQRVLLEAAEKRIDEKVAELESLKQTLEQLLIQHDEQEERQLNSLVIIYENMKPKDAARIFEELDMVVLLDVIERMKERKTAPILAELNPKRAKTITIELAHRRNLPGTAKD